MVIFIIQCFGGPLPFTNEINCKFLCKYIVKTVMYSWIKYRCQYDTQRILGNIPIIVIPYSYMSYLRLFDTVSKMSKLI